MHTEEIFEGNEYVFIVVKVSCAYVHVQTH